MSVRLNTSDWNRFEEWINGIVELGSFVDDTEKYLNNGDF